MKGLSVEDRPTAANGVLSYFRLGAGQNSFPCFVCCQKFYLPGLGHSTSYFNNNNRELIERFQNLKALYNLK